MLDSKIKIAIGVVTLGSMKTHMVHSLCSMLKDLKYEYILIFKEGGALHNNREQICQLALDADCTHVLFIDSDMSFEKDVLDRLLKHDKEIIGVHYNHRRLPLKSTAILLSEPPENGLNKCIGVGTGLLLIKINVFKKLSHPWFFWENDEKGNQIVSEDFWFCRKAREYGFTIYLDATIDVKHVGTYLY